MKWFNLMTVQKSMQLLHRVFSLEGSLQTVFEYILHFIKSLSSDFLNRMSPFFKGPGSLLPQVTFLKFGLTLCVSLELWFALLSLVYTSMPVLHMCAQHISWNWLSCGSMPLFIVQC